MHGLELRTLLSIFATALVFGCTPIAIDRTDTPDLPEDEDEEEADDDEFVGDDDDDDDVQDDDDDEVDPTDDDDAAADDDDDDDDTPVGDCMDSYEENDDFASAIAIGLGAFEALTLCDGDDDFYAVSLLAGDYVTVDVSFIDAEGDVDVKLLDSHETQLDSSTSVGDLETVEALIEEDGEYIVRVYLYGDDGEVGQVYDMDIEVGEAPEEPVEPPAEPCPEDDFIGNDEANPATVTAGTWNDLAVCTGEDDWFAVDVAAGQVLTVDLLFVDDEGDIDLRVVDPDGVPHTSVSVDDNETVTLEDTVAGTHLIRAYLFSDVTGTDVGNLYDLVVTVQ